MRKCPKALHKYAKACTSMQKRAQVFKSMHKYAKACTSMQKHAQVCKNMHKYAKASTSMQMQILWQLFPAFSKFYNDIFRLFFKIVMTFLKILWQHFPAFLKILCQLFPALFDHFRCFKITFYLCFCFIRSSNFVLSSTKWYYTF